MKKILIFLCSLIALASLAPAALALPNGNFGFDKTAEVGTYTTSGKAADTIEGIVQKVVNGFLSLIAIFFFGLMLYGGLRWMTARGNDEFTLKGKNIIEAAIIGLVIILSAYAITTFVFGQLGG